MLNEKKTCFCIETVVDNFVSGIMEETYLLSHLEDTG